MLIMNYFMQYKRLFIGALFFNILFSIGNGLIALVLTDITNIAVSKNLDAFYAIVWKSAVFFLALGVLYYLYSITSKKLICRIISSLRMNVFRGIFNRNMSDFREVNSADYLSALTNDIKLIEENYLMPLLLIMQNIFVFIISLVVMLYLSPIATLCLFISMAFLIVIPSFFGLPLQKRQGNLSLKYSELTIKLKDLLSGFEVIKSYKIRAHANKDFENKNDGAIGAKYAVDSLYALNEAVSVLLSLMTIVSVMFLAAYLIIKGHLTAGVLIGLIQVSGNLTNPIQLISENAAKIKSVKPIIQRLHKMADYNNVSFTGIGNPSFEESIRFKDVSFHYNEHETIIDHLNLTIRRNKKYLIIGKSGCGKSTLINLLTAGFADYKGDILYDNENVRSLDNEKLIGLSSVIHQNIYMFDESIRDNICLHKEAEEQALESALNISGVNLFLDDTKCLDSMVGENGANLSGGQRQRIAVARALMQQKPILIIDEGTSAIDMQTAYDIESKLLRMDNLTVITITHSMNPKLLNSYDEIIFMEHGKVREIGSFKDLMESRTAFYDFYSPQEAV